MTLLAYKGFEIVSLGVFDLFYERVGLALFGQFDNSDYILRIFTVVSNNIAFILFGEFLKFEIFDRDSNLVILGGHSLHLRALTHDYLLSVSFYVLDIDWLDSGKTGLPQEEGRLSVHFLT